MQSKNTVWLQKEIISFWFISSLVTFQLKPFPVEKVIVEGTKQIHVNDMLLHVNIKGIHEENEGMDSSCGLRANWTLSWTNASLLGCVCIVPVVFRWVLRR